MDRRGFLALGAAATGALMLPGRVRAAGGRALLTAQSRVIEVGGKAATVWGLAGPDGRQGLVLEPGAPFAVDLVNGLDRPTLIHWHGQIPPHAQDGVPDAPAPKLAPGERRAYDFAPRAGTHWMHAHIVEQEFGLLAAPLIVRTAADATADRQEVNVFLHDFSFRPPEEVLATITGGSPAAGSMPMDMAHMDMSQMDMSQMGAMDLNDFDFDAYLANDRTLDDPEVVAVEKGGRVLLRIINGSAATVYWIDAGSLAAEVVAVDGVPVVPHKAGRVGLAMGQRLDLLVTIPAEGGAFPILALREGARERTGIVLATKGAAVAKVAGLAEADHPAFSADLAQEQGLAAVTPLPERPADQAKMLMLSGSMAPYQWAISDGVTARTGERVEITFHNMSMMAHPMHLHGHAFQVVAINGARFAGAVRDTVHVPPMARITVALDAGEAAPWMLHCHHAAHMASGMMTEFRVTA